MAFNNLLDTLSQSQYTSGIVQAFNNYFAQNQANSVLQNIDTETGEGALQVLKDAAAGKGELTEEQYAVLHDLIAKENTTQAYERDKEFAQNSLLWDADQLGSLGLGAQGVLQTGGTSGSNNAAQVDMTNIAQAKYERKLGMAKAMCSLAGSLMSAGVRGTPLKSVRDAASYASIGSAYWSRR